MIINDLKYIKLALWVPYILIGIWVIYIYQIYISSSSENLIIPVVMMFIIFRSIFGLAQTIMKKELYRRIAKLPIAKTNIMNWKMNRNVGISFMDFEKSTFWFCGTQTDFAIPILPMENMKYNEFYDHIVFMDGNTGNRYIVYKYSQL